MQLTILMPCLNEEENIAFCIREADQFPTSHSLSGEILVVDNGFADRSASAASSLGAIVINESRKGYGRAIRTGLERAGGSVIIFGDSDSTYDFFNLERIYTPLALNEADFVTGDRFSMKSTGKYAFLYLAVICLFVLAMTAVSTIPESLIRKKAQESADYLLEHDAEFYNVVGGAEGYLYLDFGDYSKADQNADAISVMMAYYLDPEHPLEAALWDSHA